MFDVLASLWNVWSDNMAFTTNDHDDHNDHGSSRDYFQVTQVQASRTFCSPLSPYNHNAVQLVQTSGKRCLTTCHLMSSCLAQRLHGFHRLHVPTYAMLHSTLKNKVRNGKRSLHRCLKFIGLPLHVPFRFTHFGGIMRKIFMGCWLIRTPPQSDWERLEHYWSNRKQLLLTEEVPTRKKVHIRWVWTILSTKI